MSYWDKDKENFVFASFISPGTRFSKLPKTSCDPILFWSFTMISSKERANLLQNSMPGNFLRNVALLIAEHRWKDIPLQMGLPVGHHLLRNKCSAATRQTKTVIQDKLEELTSIYKMSRKRCNWKGVHLVIHEGWGGVTLALQNRRIFRLDLSCEYARSANKKSKCEARARVVFAPLALHAFRVFTEKLSQKIVDVQSKLESLIWNDRIQFVVECKMPCIS